MKKKKITMGYVLFSLIMTVFTIIILDKIFVALSQATEFPELYAHLIGFIVPGATEIFNIIIPYLKQNKIIN